MRNSARYVLPLYVAFSLLLLCVFIFDIPHSLLSYTISAPGSMLTTCLNLNVSPFARRVLEPSILLTYLGFIYLSAICIDQKKSKKLSYCGIAFILAIQCEGIVLANPVQYGAYPHVLMYVYVISKILLTSSLVFFSITLFSFKNTDFATTPKEHKYKLTYILTPAIIFLISTLFGLDTKFSERVQKLSTHYYVWFPENWNAGYAHKKKHNTTSLLGEYNSDNPDIIRKQVSSIEEKNIDIIFLDWWPTKRNLRKRAKIFIKNIPKNSKITYAMHIETQDLAGSDKLIELNSKNIEILNRTVLGLAQRFFKDPRYLEINSKKVINLYTTRHIIGDFSGFIKNLRSYIKEKTGYELYIIGDEAYYNVLQGESRSTLKMLNAYIPDWERIHSFDAVTLYNPYDPQKDYGNTPNEKIENLIKETSKLYKNYYSISTTAGIPFMPTAIPGYDDTGVRPLEKHQIIERQFNRGSTLQELMKVSAESIHNLPTKTINITSWNEWNEGTNIEE